MSEKARKRRSKWDDKEENQISALTSEQNACPGRESPSRHLGHDPNLYDLEPDDAMKSRDFIERQSREPSPKMSGQRDAERDSYNISRSRRPGDVATCYPASPRSHGSGQQNHFRSPEATLDNPRRRSRSRGRGNDRSRSPSGGRNRSRSPSLGRNRSRSPSPSRGRERDRVYGRSRSPRNEYRRDPRGGLNDRRSDFGAPPPQVCRNFTAGNCWRGNQCMFLHPDNPNPRDGGRSERDQPERWGMRGQRGGRHYDVEREEPVRNRNLDVCNDFLKGRCHRGSSCRYSHDAAGDNSHERQQYIVPCKFFIMGNCTRTNCRFAHDAPMQYSHEVVPRDDRRNRDYVEKNSTRNGPKWDGAERSGRHSVVKDGGWNGSTLDDVVGLSDVVGTMEWGGRGIENVVTTDPIVTQRDHDVELDHLDNESKIWNDPDSHDVDMEIAGSEPPNEITKVEPHSTLDSMQYQTPYEFSKPTSTVTPLVFPEQSQFYNNMEGNMSIACGFDSVNGRNIYANAKHTTPMPEHDFNQQSNTYGLPPQQFSGICEGLLVNSINPSDEHNIEFNKPVQENISHFKVQNSTDTQHGYPAKPAVYHSMPQTIEHKPMQISNLPSVTEKFVNEQLPQLYAVLNPPKPAGAMASIPDSVNAFPSLSSINTQPDQTSMYQKRNSNEKLDIDTQYPGFSSSIATNGGSVNNNHMNSQLSQQKMVPDPVLEEPSKPIAEKRNQEPENTENVEADTKVGDSANSKDEKAMRLFKIALVEFVKNILKPKWKEGGMSRDVHKAIVKKVADKVTSAIQGVNIPNTQAKLDQYLESSRPKLAKLVEAYVERYAKTS